MIKQWSEDLKEQWASRAIEEGAIHSHFATNCAPCAETKMHRKTADARFCIRPRTRAASHVQICAMSYFLKRLPILKKLFCWLNLQVLLPVLTVHWSGLSRSLYDESASWIWSLPMLAHDAHVSRFKIWPCTSYLMPSSIQCDWKATFKKQGRKCGQRGDLKARPELWTADFTWLLFSWWIEASIEWAFRCKRRVMVLLHGTRGPTVCFESGRKSSGRSSWKNTNGYWASRCSGTVSGGFVQKERKALQHCRDRKTCVRVNAVNAPETVEPLRFGKGSVQELPIFPLSIVAFPTSDTPLNIFEARWLSLEILTLQWGLSNWDGIEMRFQCKGTCLEGIKFHNHVQSILSMGISCVDGT